MDRFSLVFMECGAGSQRSFHARWPSNASLARKSSTDIWIRTWGFGGNHRPNPVDCDMPISDRSEWVASTTWRSSETLAL